jgi:polyphenol oxidase
MMGKPHPTGERAANRLGVAETNAGATLTLPTPITAASLSPFHHGFFGRTGGVSSGLYDSLNCGLGSNDARPAVLENRQRVATALGLASAPLLTCHQIHSADAVIVTEPWEPGAQPKADALVTDRPGLLLGALAADCMPILFADAAAGVVAAAHAGWKGALGGVAEATLKQMEKLGAQRGRVHAVVGPCISQANYEVGPEFLKSFTDVDPAFARFFTAPEAGGRPYFDLPGFMLAKLRAAGVASAVSLGLCTYQHPDRFYSYRRTTHRREPDYGRQVAVIAANRR